MPADTLTSARIPFDNSYARLPDRFAARLAPTPVSEPRLIRINVPLAKELGIDPEWLASPEGVAVLAGNRIVGGSEPLAQAYAGHQFGGFSPQLGDGRAILLGEVVDRNGRRRDIQLKGSGPTPFSRRGDGRAALGPVLREYIVSEAMAAFGIPTTRALAAVLSGDHVFREAALPGAILTRVAASHVRVGTFQYFAVRKDSEAVRTLADYVIARHYPEAASARHPYAALLDAVVSAQAALVARWMLVGFIHGVMNTDNCTISGETIDYGPCAFMDTFHFGMVLSSIDTQGRYAYGNQPHIAQWNLARLAETLLPILAETPEAAMQLAQTAISSFGERYVTAYTEGLRPKLGLATAEPGDLDLGQALLEAMMQGEADFTLTFRQLADAAADPAGDASVASLFKDPALFTAWAATWRARLAREPGTPAERRERMRQVNPRFIPRNHRIEAAIAAALAGDFTVFERLLQVLARPFDEQPEHADYATPPRPEEVVQQTFCGT